MTPLPPLWPLKYPYSHSSLSPRHTTSPTGADCLFCLPITGGNPIVAGRGATSLALGGNFISRAIGPQPHSRPAAQLRRAGNVARTAAGRSVAPVRSASGFARVRRVVECPPLPPRRPLKAGREGGGRVRVPRPRCAFGVSGVALRGVWGPTAPSAGRGPRSGVPISKNDPVGVFAAAAVFFSFAAWGVPASSPRRRVSR